MTLQMMKPSVSMTYTALILGSVQLIALLYLPAKAEVLEIKQVGSSTFIQVVPDVSLRGLMGAIIGTSIAAKLQSQPIPLAPNTDFACKYQDTLTVKLKNCK